MSIFGGQDISVFMKIISSSHINFLFGAGVNGNALPQMKDFVKTKEIMTSHLKREVSNFEADLNEITSQATKDRIMKSFTKELKEAIDRVDKECDAIKDIENLFQSINNLVIQTENRNSTMKQVNIYTTNYDSIVDECLDRNGLLYNVVSSSNYSNHDKFFEMIGYDYRKKRYVPTYLVSKIHGDINDPILPNISKYDDALQSKRFEIIFNMRTQLSRYNSVLFVIGYSGGDKHINTLIKDCISFGLSVYWFKYDNHDNLPNELEDIVTVIEQPDNNNKQNTTVICKEVIEGIWRKKTELSEE